MLRHVIIAFVFLIQCTSSTLAELPLSVQEVVAGDTSIYTYTLWRIACGYLVSIGLIVGGGVLLSVRKYPSFGVWLGVVMILFGCLGLMDSVSRGNARAVVSSHDFRIENVSSVLTQEFADLQRIELELEVYAGRKNLDRPITRLFCVFVGPNEYAQRVPIVTAIEEVCLQRIVRDCSDRGLPIVGTCRGKRWSKGLQRDRNVRGDLNFAPTSISRFCEAKSPRRYLFSLSGWNNKAPR